MDDDQSVNPVLKVNQVKTDCFPCPHCDRTFPLKQLLDLHLPNHDRQRRFECDECTRKFFTKYDLQKHLQTHNGEKPYDCIICKKSFSRESLLRRHEKIHVDVPKYVCNQCDKTFLTKQYLDAHQEKHKKRRPFTCQVCNKSFVFKQVSVKRKEGRFVFEISQKRDLDMRENFWEQDQSKLVRTQLTVSSTFVSGLGTARGRPQREQTPQMQLLRGEFHLGDKTDASHNLTRRSEAVSVQIVRKNVPPEPPLDASHEKPLRRAELVAGERDRPAQVRHLQHVVQEEGLPH